MHFKKLEIFGFKSFADKTRLHFKGGVSAIIGPNGVGKSNISDAIRWVLGEQSARSLRGSKMEDVIFAGTHTRKPLGLADVSLTFSNSEKILPLNCEEITIKRKLFRSGESEYSLNKTPCRLKDISSLFLNKGMSNIAYSLIDQRSINLLLSPRPEEKREIFEQAAGIGLYRQKKKESLRKFEQTEANLVRVSDIVNELQQQMKVLNREASKAKQYQKKLERLKEIEVKCYAFQYNRMKEEEGLIGKEKKELEEQKEKLGQKLEEIEKKFKDCNKQLYLLEEKFSDAYEQKLKIERLKERNDNQIVFNQQQSKQTEEDVKKINSELERIESKIIQSDKDIKKKDFLIQELQKKKEILSDSDRRVLTLDDILKEVDTINQELDTVSNLNLLKEKLSKYFFQLKNKIKQLFLSLIEEKTENSDAKLVSLEEKEKLEIEMSQMLKQTLAETQHEKEGKEKQINRLSEKKKILEEEIIKLKNGRKNLLLQKQEIEKNILKLKDEKQILSKLVNQRREEEGEKEKRFFSLTEKIQDLEIKEQELVLKMRNIDQRAEEKYSLDVTKVVFQKINLEEMLEEIEILNRKLQGLGNVSLSTIEEQKRLDERLTFLIQQREDLIAAKSSIQQAIIKLDKQAKEMFVQTLERVEKEFAHFFKLLFLGGEAKIERQGDILNSDIKIIVHPPGKKLQDALLLSAGERTLTAIALLFALFKVRPNPFCVLDEIDASLDDFNIGRFVDILKEFIPKTQFIIITHSKKTISIADIIYGVTMEEKGVSKLISVNLSEKEA